MKYLINCFWLMIPVFTWNLLFYDQLPALYQVENFWNDIPPWLKVAEHSTRILAFALIALMPLSLKGERKQLGVWLYLIGIIFYVASWLVLIYQPNSAWSLSIIGQLAPAFTPAVWLVGIGIIASKFYVKLPFQKYLYPVFTLLFLLFHNLHVLLIILRN